MNRKIADGYHFRRIDYIERVGKNIEHGEREPGVRTAIRIAEVLGVNVKTLFQR